MPHHERRISRSQEYDYTNVAWYYVTICSRRKREIFGDIKNMKMELNKTGLIVDECWKDIPQHFSFVELDYYIIMPDHLHGIIIINPHGMDIALRSDISLRRDMAILGRDMACHVPTEKRIFSKPIPGSLSTIIGSFKSAATKKIHETMNNKTSVWQPRFYDRVIRNEKELYNIRKYIDENPIHPVR